VIDTLVLAHVHYTRSNIQKPDTLYRTKKSVDRWEQYVVCSRTVATTTEQYTGLVPVCLHLPTISHFSTMSSHQMTQISVQRPTVPRERDCREEEEDIYLTQKHGIRWM